MIPFLMAGMTLMQGIKSQNEAKATNTMNKANTFIANLQKDVQNETNAATGALTRMAQSIKNKNMLRAGGKQQEAISMEQIRLTEQMMTGKFSSRIQAAEQAGALTASAGAAGIGGSTVDMLASVGDLRQAMLEQEATTTYDRDYFALTQAQDENVYQMYNNIDDTLVIDNIQVADIIGPAKLDTGIGGALLNTGMSFVQGMYQTGGFSKGGAMDFSQSSGGFSGLLGRAFGKTAAQPTGANYQLGATLLP